MCTYLVPVFVSCLSLLVPCATATAQVRVSKTDRGVLVQGPHVAGAPGQLTADAVALESIEIGPPVKGAPFSAEAMTVIVQTLADGNRIVRRTTGSIYRDSRGRTRREVSFEGMAGIMLPGAALQMITISDPDSGMTYVVDSEKQLRKLRSAPDAAAATTPAAPRIPLGRGAKPKPTVTSERREILGTREIEGIVCDGTRTIVTIPAGAIGNERAIESITERWFSSELRVVILSRRSDPRFGETTYRLTNVTRAEPPATLFEPPIVSR